MKYFSLPKGKLKLVWHHFITDSLFRNAVYLMLSTGVMALFGFLFWIITTRLYSTEQIGIATALISVTVFLSNFCLLGFNTTLVRKLPKAKNPDSIINTSITIVGLVSMFVTIIYIVFISFFNPKLIFLQHNKLVAAAFILFMAAVSINTLTDSVFVAYRQSQYNLIVYSIFGFLKVALPPFLVVFGAFGIFLSYTTSVVVGLFLSLYFMHRRFGHKLKLTISKSQLREIGRYSFGNYLSNFLSGAMLLIIPIIVINHLGAKAAAYFYIASTITNLLYIIPIAMGQSLLAEGSHSKEDLLSVTKNAFKVTFKLLVPAIIIVFVGANLVLSIFGKEYSKNSSTILQILALTSLFYGVTSICSAVLRIAGRIKVMVTINGFSLLIAIVTAVYATRWGLKGVAVSVVISQALQAILFATAIKAVNFKTNLTSKN